MKTSCMQVISYKEPVCMRSCTIPAKGTTCLMKGYSRYRSSLASTGDNEHGPGTETQEDGDDIEQAVEAEHGD